MTKENQKEDNCQFERLIICPNCGGANLKHFITLEYENQDDPTPEYGGCLREVMYYECLDCGCVDI